MKTTTILILVGVILLALILFSTVGSKEYYGGQIKNVRRIPFNDCARIIEGYRRDCWKKYSGTDAGWCEERFGPTGSAILECYYSNSHRL